MVGAFAAENQLVLGEIVTDEKSNEITAVPTLLEDISLCFEHFSGELPSCVTKVKDHGRSERRNDRLLTDLPWLPQRTEWDGLQAVGMVTAAISKNDETTTDTRYFLSSVTDVERFAAALNPQRLLDILFA